MPPHSHVLSLVVLTNPWMQVVDGLEGMEELRIQVHQEGHIIKEEGLKYLSTLVSEAMAYCIMTFSLANY